MLACTRDNQDIIEYLLEKNANLVQVNKDGWNALQIAVREGHPNIVELLIRRNPRLVYEVKTKNGRTPAHTAALHGHLNVLKCIIESSGEKKGEILTSRDNCGNTVLMEAALGDNLDVVKYLLENFQEVNIHDRDSLSNSIIHLIFQSGSIKSCEYLFDSYFGPNTIVLEVFDKFSKDLNKFQMTPLHSACKNNKPELVRFLVAKFRDDHDPVKADYINERWVKLLEQKDSHGRSSIEIVKVSKFTEIESIFSHIYKYKPEF